MIKDYFKKSLHGIKLALSLAGTNFKLRNEGSYLGILWYLLEPLCFFLIILLVGQVINSEPIEFYPLYLFLGLIMFNFFINSTMASARAIISHGQLIKSMKIIQESLVISSVFQFVFSHILEMVIFLGFMVYFKANFLNLIFYVPIFFFYILFVLGVSFVLAAVGVYINDLPNIWIVATRLLWFLTPIFYVVPSSSLYQTINYFNPMFHFINISREIIIYGDIPKISTLALAVVSSFLSLIFGIIVFSKLKNKFAEKI